MRSVVTRRQLFARSLGALGGLAWLAGAAAQTVTAQRCAKCGQPATHQVVQRKRDGAIVAGKAYYCAQHAAEWEASDARVKSIGQGLLALAVGGYVAKKFLFNVEARKKDWYVWLLLIVILTVGPFVAYGIYNAYQWLGGR